MVIISVIMEWVLAKHPERYFEVPEVPYTEMKNGRYEKLIKSKLDEDSSPLLEFKLKL